MKACIGTRDSYGKFNTMDTNKIINIIKEKKYNLYSGGRTDSTMAIIRNYKPGFDYKECIKLQFESEMECRKFESQIKNLFNEDNFAPRKY